MGFRDLPRFVFKGLWGMELASNPCCERQYLHGPEDLGVKRS